MIYLQQYKNDLAGLLKEKNIVKKMYFFGSVLTPLFDENKSDIDVLIETENMNPEEKGKQLLELWDGLENLFCRKVDLLTENSLKNPYLASEINQTRKLIYDGQSKQIYL